MAGTYSYYAFSFTEIPDIKFYYKASMPEAAGLIHADITKNHIDNDGNLLDEELTKKILKRQSYSEKNEDNNQEFFLKLGKNSEDSYDVIELKDFSSDMMPIYRVKILKMICMRCIQQKNIRHLQRLSSVSRSSMCMMQKIAITI